MCHVVWNRFDYEARLATAPKHRHPVWIRDRHTDGATIGYFDGSTFRTWTGSDDCHVLYWAEMIVPAGPEA